MNNQKVWYIKIEGKEEGPYSIFELRRDSRITPDTWVRREGSSHWKLMATVKELKEVFEDAIDMLPKPPSSDDALPETGEEMMLALDKEYFPWWWGMIIAAIVVFIYLLLTNQ